MNECTCPDNVTRINDLCPHCLAEYQEWCVTVESNLGEVLPDGAGRPEIDFTAF